MDNQVEFQKVGAYMYLDIREESPASGLLFSYIPECLTYEKRRYKHPLLAPGQKCFKK